MRELSTPAARAVWVFGRARDAAGEQLKVVDALAHAAAEALRAEGLTLRDAAPYLGVSHATVQKMLDGASSPRPWATRKKRGQR